MDPDILRCNLSQRDLIFIIFDKSVADILGNPKLFYLPTSPD